MALPSISRGRPVSETRILSVRFTVVAGAASGCLICPRPLLSFRVLLYSISGAAWVYSLRPWPFHTFLRGAVPPSLLPFLFSLRRGLSVCFRRVRTVLPAACSPSFYREIGRFPRRRWIPRFAILVIRVIASSPFLSYYISWNDKKSSSSFFFFLNFRLFEVAPISCDYQRFGTKSYNLLVKVRLENCINLRTGFLSCG